MSSGSPGDFLAVFLASEYTWCEALSPGVPKPSAALRANLWSEVSFLHPFWISRSVPEAGSGNRVPKPSAGPPKKVWAPTPATGTNGNSRHDGPEVNQMTTHRRSRREGPGSEQQESRGVCGCFLGFLLHMVRSTLPRSPEALGAASRKSMV